MGIIGMQKNDSSGANGIGDVVDNLYAGAVINVHKLIIIVPVQRLICGTLFVGNQTDSGIGRI